jgi:hypothetical protein
MNHEGHEDHEEHEEEEEHEADCLSCSDSERPRMRLPSPLTARAERVMAATIGCAIAVHRELGPGFLESIYRKAMYIELEAKGLTFESERRVRVFYRGIDVPGPRIDLIVENEIVVERGGLLINCRVPVLRQGLKRIVV